MRKFLACFALFVTAPALTQDGPVFSKHSPALQTASVDKNTVLFKGELRLAGELVFEFNPQEQEGVFRAFFIPDPAEREKLPQVIGGHRPKPLTRVGIRDGDRVLVMTFGRETASAFAKGAHSYASARAIILMRDFGTTIECDSRQYYARVAQVARDGSRTILADARDGLAGC